MLLLLLFVHQAWSGVVSTNTNLAIKEAASCNQVGYFFRRESNPNSLPGCLLCFCQDDGTFFCWKREEKRCDVEKYHFHNAALKRKRPPRSPAFSDIFFKDAANSFFGNRAEGECTPYESSFSDDCPPADWCTGCTVCDCTGDGKWECHLLSFCPDGSGKKTVKKRKPNKPIVRRRNNNQVTTKAPPLSKTTIATTKAKKMIKKSVPVTVKRNQTQRRGKIPVRFKNNPRKNTPRQHMFIKKDVSTNKPVSLVNKKPKLINKPDHSVDPKQMAKKVVKRVIAAVTKIMKNEIKGNKTTYIKKTQKRSIKKVMNNKNNTKPSPRPKFIEKHKKKVTNAVTVMPNKNNKGRRIKRDVVNVTESILNITETSVSNTSTTKDYSTILVNSITEPPTVQTATDQNIAIFSEDTNYKVTQALSAYYNYIVERNLNNKSEIININLSSDKTTNTPSTNYTKHKLLNNKANFNDMNAENKLRDRHLEIINSSNDLLSMKDILSYNDLKNTRWSRIKVLKEKKIKTNLRQNNKKKVFTTEKKKINGKDVPRRIGLPKKYNLKKIINTNKRAHVNADTTKAASNKINDLQNFIRDLLKNVNRNDTNTKSKRVIKRKKSNALRFMKKFFNKLFSQKTVSNKHNMTFNKHHIIETLCESFGPCQIDARNRLLVKTKIDELYKETVNILRSIQIIKGLLKLIDIPKTNKDYILSNKKFRHDVQKLNVILKRQYLDVEWPLTETQSFQIEYIRNNTNHFIKSIGNFAKILNEIINLLTNHDKNRRVLRDTDKGGTWDSIKKLLRKYNLIQNTFIKKMYEMITLAESKDENKYNNEVKINKTVSMETYSKNIVKKLRKLKNLANLLSPRKKRQTTRDEDTLEYLLMLMEYLLKQSYPLDATPPNDGIDLLIDAIRNAPDIKPIKKKVLKYTSADIAATRTVKPSFRKNEDKSEINEESKEVMRSSDDKNEISYTEEKVTITEKPITKDSKEVIIRKFLPIEDFDDNDDEKYDFNRKNIDAADLFGGREETTPVIEQLTEKPKDIPKESHENSNNVRRFEFYPDIDENVAIANSVVETSTATFVVTEKPIDDVNEDFPKLRKNSDSSENLGKRSKIDWIEENFDTEIAESRTENITTPVLVTSTVKNKIVTTTQPQVDISSITKELIDEDKRSKMRAEDLMFRKQMDLLNSLDYVTERDEVEENFTDGAENFASYFV